jgi:hypothetical protein
MKFQPSANALAQHLPRHQVRMVLDIADHNLVAGLHISRAPAMGDQVYRLGRAAHKDDLALVGGVEKRADLFARLLEPVGRARAQLVDAAVHVGVVAAVELGDAVDDLARLLRARPGVEKYQAGIALEDRKLATQPLRVEPAQYRTAAHSVIA